MVNEIPTNPFEATVQITNVVRRRGRARAFLLALSFGCYALAGVLYFCSQSWTFYTPYSAETTWEVSLPGRMTFWISTTLGLPALAVLISLGSILLLLGLVPWRNRLVDNKGN